MFLAPGSHASCVLITVFGQNPLAGGNETAPWAVFILVEHTDDPVLAKRAKIAKLVSRGLKTGTLLFALSFVAFFFGLTVGFSQPVSLVASASLIVGSFVLAPAIVFMYAVRAANRADAESSW